MLNLFCSMGFRKLEGPSAGKHASRTSSLLHLRGESERQKKERGRKTNPDCEDHVLLPVT